MSIKLIQIILNIYESTSFQNNICKCSKCGEYEFILTSPGPGNVHMNCANCYHVFENLEPLLVPLEQVSKSGINKKI